LTVFPRSTPHVRAVGATLALSAILVAGASSVAAVADTNGLELSTDGVTFGPTLSAPLFDSMPPLVPTQTATASFVVRNGSAVPAYLSVVLGGRGWDSWDYASSLSVTAASPGSASGAATLTSNDNCAVLLHGHLLQPGETAVVATSITLGDLGGVSGQQASAWMVLTVKLTQSATSRSPRACSSGGSTVVVVPDANAPVATPEPSATPTTDPAPGVDPVTGLPAFSNTASGWDGRFVFAALLAVPLGAAFYFLASRRRSNHDGDASAPEFPKNPPAPELQLEDAR
jgi:hypothetical protein